MTSTFEKRQIPAEPDFSRLTAENILSFDRKGLSYDDTIKFRERLQSIRREKGMDFGYTVDIWPEHWLHIFMQENIDNQNLSELLFQEKKYYLTRLIRNNFDKLPGAAEELSEFFNLYWDEDGVDGLESLRREKGERAHDPVSNSPGNGWDLDSGRIPDSRFNWLSLPEEKLTPEKKEFVQFIRDLDDDITVVDLGCGHGSSFVKGLFEIGKLKPVNRINIDLDPRNIEFMNQFPDIGTNTVADAAATGLPSESAGIIVFNMVLADNYLTTKNKKAILAEIVRVLKPGGYLVGQTGLGPKTIRQYFDEVKIGGSTFYRRK